MLSAEASNRTPHKSDSITESQFSSVMPYTEDTGQTSDSVFIETSTDPHVSQHISQTPSQNNTSNASSSVETTPVQTPVPKRSARSTKGAPPICYGKVITIVPGLQMWQTHLLTDKPYRSHVFQILFLVSVVNMYLDFIINLLDICSIKTIDMLFHVMLR